MPVIYRLITAFFIQQQDAFNYPAVSETGLVVIFVDVGDVAAGCINAYVGIVGNAASLPGLVLSFIFDYFGTFPLLSKDKSTI